MVEQFRRYKPLTFDGDSDPMAVEEWIRGLERIFQHIACTNAQKVLYVEFYVCWSCQSLVGVRLTH